MNSTEREYELTPHDFVVGSLFAAIGIGLLYFYYVIGMGWVARWLSNQTHSTYSVGILLALYTVPMLYCTFVCGYIHGKHSH